MLSMLGITRMLKYQSLDILELDSLILPPISYIFLSHLPDLLELIFIIYNMEILPSLKGLLYLPYKVITYDNICKIINICEVTIFLSNT